MSPYHFSFIGKLVSPLVCPRAVGFQGLGQPPLLVIVVDFAPHRWRSFRLCDLNKWTD
jgi:hypothetical protein